MSEGLATEQIPMGLGLCGVHTLSLDAAQASARQPPTRVTVEATAWVVSQCTYSSSRLALDLTSLSFTAPTSEGCSKD